MAHIYRTFTLFSFIIFFLSTGFIYVFPYNNKRSHSLTIMTVEFSHRKMECKIPSWSSEIKFAGRQLFALLTTSGHRRTSEWYPGERKWSLDHFQEDGGLFNENKQLRTEGKKSIQYTAAPQWHRKLRSGDHDKLRGLLILINFVNIDKLVCFENTYNRYYFGKRKEQATLSHKNVPLMTELQRSFAGP